MIRQNLESAEEEEVVMGMLVVVVVEEEELLAPLPGIPFDFFGEITAFTAVTLSFKFLA